MSDGRDLSLHGGFDAAAAQRQFTEELEQWKRVPLPTLAELLELPVVLMHHEAHGGETILAHLGRDEFFLHRRQFMEHHLGQHFVKSTFRTLAEAEQVVSEALQDAAELIRGFPSSDGTFFPFRVPLRQPAGLLVTPDGTTATATSVVVKLFRDEDGRVVVNVAYPELHPSGNADYPRLEQLILTQFDQGWIYLHHDEYEAAEAAAVYYTVGARAELAAEIERLLAAPLSPADLLARFTNQAVVDGEAFAEVLRTLHGRLLRAAAGDTSQPIVHPTDPGWAARQVSD